MTKEEKVLLWINRISQIEEKGNVVINIHRPQPFFHSKYTKQEMIDYCQRMIDRITNDRT